MDKLLKEIYEDILNGYENLSYTYHDEELGYDTISFELMDGFLVGSEYYRDDIIVSFSFKMEIEEIKKIEMKEFINKVNKSIYYNFMF